LLRLYWIRHGENLANLTKEFSSRRVDYSLTTKGVLQAQQTAEYFAPRPIRAVYTSPLKRAVETAQIIAAPLHLQPVILENFREIDVGELEDRPPSAENWALHNAILKDWLEGNVSRSFPGGEDQLALWERMRCGLERIFEERDGGEVIVVSHGGILFLTMLNFCPNLNLTDMFDIPNCSITEILLTRPDGRLHGELTRWADYSHLRGQAADLVYGAPEEDDPFFRPPP
jgi:broad specificity phosphatase PhoE